MFDPFAIAMQISDCVCVALKDPARGAEVWSGDCCIIAGGSGSWDNCCESAGTMWVAMVGGYPTNAFPAQARTPLTNCIGTATSQAVDFEIGVVRCVCTMQEDGSDCGCEQRERDAHAVMGDLSAVLSALACCFDDSVSSNSVCDSPWILNSWRSLGRMGGCAGIAVSITLETDSICCPAP